MIVFLLLLLWLTIHARKRRGTRRKAIVIQQTPPPVMYTNHAITAARADIKALQAQKKTLQGLANYLSEAITTSENPQETIRLHSQLANTYSKLATVEGKLNKAQSRV